ncbi:MAG: trigger factor [Acholeplasmatales bacterium]|nr:MAG: trigger factor [Acholeplasmatales bacterium]
MAKLEKISDARVKLTVEVSAAQFEHGLDYAFDQIKDDVEIKGFRKGKVSRKVFEQHKGVESLYEDAINHVIQETYHVAVEEENLDVVAQPKIDLDITAVKKGAGFTYTATVAIKPPVTLGQYKGFTYNIESTEVTEAEIDTKMNELLGQNAQLVVKEAAELSKDDTAVFDFEGFVDGEAFEGGKAENHELVIGSGQFIPGFEEQMIGMKPGEARDVQVTFPEAYQAEHLAGKDAIFKTKLHEVKVRQVPELNDAFVKDLEREGIETVDALKEDTKKSLLAEKKQSSENKAIDFAVEQAAKQATIDIPEEMITQEKNRQIDNIKRQVQQYGMPFEQYLQFSGLDQETFEKNTEEQAERAIRYNLTIEAVSAAEGITATDEEVEAKYADIAKQYNLEVEQVRSQVDSDAVKQEVVFRKTIDFLVSELTPESEEKTE